MTSPHGSGDEDEQLALDMQLAYDLQEQEEMQAKQRQRRNVKHDGVLEDGFAKQKLSADHMLFVSCTIDGHKVDMLVDTGASTSAMTVEMVTKLGLGPKLNTGIVGSAKGVGSSRMLGIVENVACTIGHVEFRLFFMALEGSMPYCILGLDQMRRFQCHIDLATDTLVFGGQGGVSVPFLPREEAALVAFKMLQEGENNETQNAKRGAGVSGALKSIFRKG